MSLPKVDATASANALDTELAIDVATDTVVITQRSDRFALHPQKVVVPFQAVVVCAANIILHKNGMKPVGESNGNESRSVQ